MGCTVTTAQLYPGRGGSERYKAILHTVLVLCLVQIRSSYMCETIKRFTRCSQDYFLKYIFLLIFFNFNDIEAFNCDEILFIDLFFNVKSSMITIDMIMVKLYRYSNETTLVIDNLILPFTYFYDFKKFTHQAKQTAYPSNIKT